MFTMQHYKKVAKAISDTRLNNIKKCDTPGQFIIAESALDRLVDELCTTFKRDNPNFDANTFKSAAE